MSEREMLEDALAAWAEKVREAGQKEPFALRADLEKAQRDAAAMRVALENLTEVATYRNKEAHAAWLAARQALASDAGRDFVPQSQYAATVQGQIRLELEVDTLRAALAAERQRCAEIVRACLFTGLMPEDEWPTEIVRRILEGK